MKDATWDPQILAEDIVEVRRIYADFFAGLSDADWERPVKGGPKEWNLHQTVAHLCALSGAALDSVEHTLRAETYTFDGLENRYQFNDFNLRGIAAQLAIPRVDLCAKFLQILDRSAEIARSLSPEQAEITSVMPIYNRPVKIIEALGIIMFHAGLHHSAQVAEPVGVPPLWKKLSPEIRHRVIGRVMRALSLLYRYDLGGDLDAAFSFHMGGTGGGEWYVEVSPHCTNSSEGHTNQRGLALYLREPSVFCRLFTGRFNPLVGLLKGELRLKGNLPLFLRFGSLFSVDARS
jgi:hypothetical protein